MVAGDNNTGVACLGTVNEFIIGRVVLHYIFLGYWKNNIKKGQCFSIKDVVDIIFGQLEFRVSQYL